MNLRLRLVPVLVLVLLMSCRESPQPSLPSPSETAEEAAKPLGVAIREPSSLDPAFLSSSQDFFLAHQLHMGLYRWDDASGKVVPALAESADVSADGLTWTFHLDGRYRFSDGKPVTATHVVRSWERLLTPEVASPGADAAAFLLNGRAYLEGKSKELGLLAPDPLTLRVTLERPLPHLPLLLASPRLAPVADAVLADPRKDASKSGEGMVSSGPYRLAAWRAREGAELAVNTQSIAPAPRSVSLRFAESEDSAMVWWTSGEVDLVVGLVPLAKVPTLRRESPDSLATFPLRSVYYLVPNLHRAVLGDSGLRRSLAASLDREGLVNRVLGAGQLPAWSILPHSYESSAGLEVVDCLGPADLAAPLSPTTLSSLAGMELLSNSSETHRLIVEFLQSNMRERLGVDWRLSLLEWGAFLSVASSHKFDMIRMTFTGGDDPVDMLENFTTDHKNNYGMYANADYDRLIERAKGEAVAEKRNGMLTEAQRMLCRDMPVIPVYISSQVYLARPPLRERLHPSADGWFSLAYLGGANG